MFDWACVCSQVLTAVVLHMDFSYVVAPSLKDPFFFFFVETYFRLSTVQPLEHHHKNMVLSEMVDVVMSNIYRFHNCFLFKSHFTKY